MDAPGANEIAATATSVYWVNYLVDSLNRVPISGGPASVVLSGVQVTGPPHLAIGSVAAYLPTWSPEILSVPLDGGPPMEVAPLLFASPPTDLAVDDDYVYFLDGYTPFNVDRVPLGGGAPMVLASEQQTAEQPIAVDDAYIYYALVATAVPPEIWRVSKTGGAPQTVAGSPGSSVLDLAVDANNVYWTATDATLASYVMSSAKDGAGLPVTLATGQVNGAPSRIAIDDTHVYWLSEGIFPTPGIPGTINRVLKTGGAVELLSSCVRRPAGIAVDASFVYWTDFALGTVARLAK